MKRLKVRWHTAMNGRDAVKKWRDGGFHLVLMDIQLPVMNGLDATKEIRRLERVNGIGVVGPKLGPEDNVKAGGEKKKESPTVEPTDDDKLKNRPLFKSSVIIVALTASSLQSDRHEALAAGCNDFLTKVRLQPSIRKHLLTVFSLLNSFGWNARSWNGDVCKRSSTLMAIDSGSTSLKVMPKTRPPTQ